MGPGWPRRAASGLLGHGQGVHVGLVHLSGADEVIRVVPAELHVVRIVQGTQDDFHGGGAGAGAVTVCAHGDSPSNRRFHPAYARFAPVSTRRSPGWELVPPGPFQLT